MGGLECQALTVGFSVVHLSPLISPLGNKLSSSSSPLSSSTCVSIHSLSNRNNYVVDRVGNCGGSGITCKRSYGFDSFPCYFKSRIRLRSLSARPDNGASESTFSGDDQLPREGVTPSGVVEREEEEEDGEEEEEAGGGFPFLSGNSAILSSCLVGLLTGIGVVLFNSAVHEIRDLFWDGIPQRGASWVREEPVQEVWKRVILVPACGGFLVSILNFLRDASSPQVDEQNAGLNPPLGGPLQPIISISNDAKAVLQPFLKAVAACVTLGTGNSLGPEGPSVEIGTSIAKGVSSLLDRNTKTKISLLAAGSAAGISSGFNAAVAGCFFAVESVLWPSPADSSSSIPNTTSMVILSAVIASVVSEVGLGSEPAFKVPNYDFRSPSELPLYLLLGVLCGLISLALSRFTSYMLAIVGKLQKDVGIPKALFPIFGGLTVGLIALAYPEILYWGFENVDILLESRPLVKGLSAMLLIQLVAVKILTTSLCRAFGLVGGYYAPSLFIGAATGMAYGKLISFAVAEFNPAINLSILEVASQQAYGLVGMAATLAGVCQVPLTAVLLLFELTQDYRIVLPLLGAVGVSSLITSGQTKRRDILETKKLRLGNSFSTRPSEMYTTSRSGISSIYIDSEKATNTNDLCEVESSLCADDSNIKLMAFEKRIFVSEAMRIRYVTVFMSTLVIEAVVLMLSEKQSYALIVDKDNILIGLLTLEDIQEFSKYAKERSKGPKELSVSEMCSLLGNICQIPWTATPDMDLLTAQMIMNKHGVSLLPVVKENVKDHRGKLVGILDTDCIILACRALAVRESLL